MQEEEAALSKFHSNLTQQALQLRQTPLEETVPLENRLQLVIANPMQQWYVARCQS
jgi:hypothetical protein